MAFGVIVSDARSTNRTSIASHLSISVFNDTSFIFGTHHSTYGFTLYLTDYHCLSPRFILSNVLVNILTNWLTFHTLCILCAEKKYSLLFEFCFVSPASPNNFYVLNFGTLILYGQKTFDVFLYEHYHPLLYQEQ